jgi:hypothetical protein
MVDTNAIIEFLEEETDLRETAQVTTFRGSRPTSDGYIQQVTLEVLDLGERAGTERYTVSFSSDDGRRGGTSGYFPAVEDALAMATAPPHWGQLG